MGKIQCSEKSGIILIQGFVVGYTLTDVGEIGLSRVRLGRQHVANDLASIQSHPVIELLNSPWRSQGEFTYQLKVVCRKFVNTVEARLLRQKAIHASQPAQLWKLTRVAERIGSQHVVDRDPKLLSKNLLAVKELANEGLATGQVGIMLDPAAAYRCRTGRNGPWT